MFINLIKDSKDKVDNHGCPLQKNFNIMLLKAYHHKVQIYITRNVVKCTI